MIIPFRFSSALAAICVVALGACGAKSPVSPSENQQTGPGATAVVTGSVLGGSVSALAAGSTGYAISGITVSVVGTSLASTVDAAGGFSLVGVPSGDVQLKFTGTGVDATLPLSQVRAAENITLVVAVSGTTATVESQRRSSSSGTELEGRIESLPPTMDAGSMRVAGQTVRTDANTRFEHGSTTRTFAFLAVGMRVHVKGQPSGSDVVASIVEIQNTNADIPVTLNGVLDSLSGDASAFRFQIGSRIVQGDQFTEFFGNGGSFASLASGTRVEVKGLQRDGYVYATRIHVEDADDDDDDDDQDDSASIHGTLTAKSGSTPGLTLIVGGTTVTTTGATEVKRRGDVQTLAALQIGQALHVVGTRQADRSIIARKIEINDDDEGGEFEIEGPAGGVTGTCPAISFGVNGFSIRATASTTFEDGACSAIKSGTKVQVKGTRNADGSVTATLVKTKN